MPRLTLLPNFPALQVSVVARVVLPLVVLSALAVYCGLLWTERLFEKRLQEDIELLARAVEKPISNSMNDGKLNEVGEVLGSIFSIGQVYGASLYDANGQLVAAAGLVDSNMPHSQIAVDAVVSGQHRSGYRHFNGRAVFSYFTPLSDAGGRINGLLQITRKRSDIQGRIQVLRQWAWWGWGLMSGLIASIAIVGHYRGVGRHVATLLQCMKEIERGSRQVSAPERGPRELRELARGFNNMLQGVVRAEQDVESHRQRERELYSRLRYSEKMAEVGRVAGGVAHELAAPLNVVDGRARRLAQLCDEAGVDAARQIEPIKAQVERMTNIVRQLLDFCRHTPTQHRAVDPNGLKDLCLQAAQGEPTGSSIAISWHSQVQNVCLKADPTRLEQALGNMIRNAVQAARQRVWIEVEQIQDRVLFHVNDDGPGLPEIDLEQLFEPFFTTKPPGQGTGLGLALVRSIAIEHEADVRVSSNTSGGCTFTLDLPVASNQLSSATDHAALRTSAARQTAAEHRVKEST